MKLFPLFLLASLALTAHAKKADADGDGIADELDKCPRTVGNSTVSSYGCTDGEKVILSVDVNFATNSTVIGQQYRGQVHTLADFMKANPSVKVEIRGYADKRGSVATNDNISQKRAEAVRQMLLQDFDVKADRVTAVGEGETAWASPHKGAEGEYRNRRVEARIYQ